MAAKNQNKAPKTDPAQLPIPEDEMTDAVEGITVYEGVDYSTQSAKDTSRIVDVELAQIALDNLSAILPDWRTSFEVQENTSRIGAFAMLNLREAVEYKGSPDWGGQSLLYRDHFGDLLEARMVDAGLSSGQRKAFKDRMRRYIADNDLVKVAMAARAVREDEQLAAEIVVEKRGEEEISRTIGEIVELAASPDSSVSIPLNGRTIPDGLVQAVESMRETVVDSKGQRRKGFDRPVTRWGKEPAKPPTTPDPVGNTGQNVQPKAQFEHLTAYLTSENFSARYFSEELWRLNTLFSDIMVGPPGKQGMLTQGGIDEKQKVAENTSAAGAVLSETGAYVAGSEGAKKASIAPYRYQDAEAAETPTTDADENESENENEDADS